MHLNIAKMIQLYESGIGTNELAIEFNCHRSTIQKWLKKSRIKLRKRSPSYHYDTTFFSNYTPESCYWAGFIMADGCIRRTTLHIKLSNKDRLHLQKFLDAIKSNYNINGSEYCTVDISGHWFIQDLQSKFGIVPRKTYIATYPDIPTTFDRHFIRGLFDGDGCITYTTCPSINFVGTEQLLTSLSYKFKSMGVKLKSGNEVPPFQRTNRNIGHIHYSGNNAKLILDWLYHDTTTYLNRKYERYCNYFT